MNFCLIVPYYGVFANWATSSYISSSKSDTILGAIGSLITAAEKQVVDLVWVLASGGVEETLGESIPTAGVSGKRREETIEVGLVLRDCDQHGFPSVDTLKFLLDGDEIGLLMVTERNGSCKGTALDLLNILQLTSPSCYLGGSVDCKSKLTACPFMDTK
ncbi:hypothetical protein WN943_011418 [Citrus x changshan-huyou]